jgi:GPH family glycoside/pentoside/hexuronide:cation symporter
MALGCHEAPIPEDEEKPALIPALTALLTNSKFWLFGLTNAFYSACMSLVIATVTLFVKHSLGLGGGSTTILQASVILCAAVSIGVWAQFVKKVGLMKLWRIGLIFLMLAFIPLYFAKGLVVAVICCILLGIAYGGVLTTMDLVGTRVLDDDYRRHGVKREGIVNSIMGFMNRLNGLFVSLATFLASRVYGYVDGNNPGNNPGGAGRFMMCLFPLICMVIAVAISRFVKFPELDEKNG